VSFVDGTQASVGRANTASGARSEAFVSLAIARSTTCNPNRSARVHSVSPAATTRCSGGMVATPPGCTGEGITMPPFTARNPGSSAPSCSRAKYCATRYGVSPGATAYGTVAPVGTGAPSCSAATGTVSVPAKDGFIAPMLRAYHGAYVGQPPCAAAPKLPCQT
jgi:hypothetical protein